MCVWIDGEERFVFIILLLNLLCLVPSPLPHAATDAAPLTVMHLQLDMGWGADEEGGDFYNPDGIKEGRSRMREGRDEREGARSGRSDRGGNAGHHETVDDLASKKTID